MEVETQTRSNFDLKAKPPFSYGINMPIDSSELHSLECQSCDLEMDALKSNGRESPVSVISSKVESPVTYGQKCEEFVDVSEKSEVFGDSSELKSPVRLSSDWAVKVQKVYRSYRTRRKLADSAVVAEELWWQAIDFARLNHSTISFFNFSKPETAALRWNRVSLNASKVGKGLSKDAQAQKLAFQHWIEAIDPRHRYGHSLHKYYEEWCKADAGQPFFYWLDIGDGKEFDLKECPRSKLRQQCIKYLGPQERENYEYIFVEGKIVHKESGNPLDTNGAKGAKWIFVMSTFKKLYAGEKKKGVFHHSSFLAGGATLAAGRLTAEQGALKSVGDGTRSTNWCHYCKLVDSLEQVLKGQKESYIFENTRSISAYSGHYRPTDERLDSFLSFLSDNGVDLNEVQIHKANEDYDNYVDSKSDVSRSVSGISTNLDPPKLVIPKKVEAVKLVEQTEGGTQTPTRNDYKRTLSGGLHSPRADVPKKAILQRINSKKAVCSYQLGHQLSLKWSTGAGPRIGCVADYPVELRLQALEFVNLSPRTPPTPSTFKRLADLASPTSPLAPPTSPLAPGLSKGDVNVTSGV